MAGLKAISGGISAPPTSADVYPFTAEYEQQVVALCCHSRDFYSRIGAHLDPKSLKAADAVNLLKACKAIAEASGEGPSSATTVIQKLRTWREQGKIKYEDVLSAVDYLDAAEDAGLLDLEEVVTEVAALLKARGTKDLARKVIDATRKATDLAKLAAEAQSIERLGQSRVTLGEGLHDDLLDAILADNAAVRFPTGCLELDSITGGGLPIGYTLFLGREKSGKSMVLSSIAAEALLRRQNVAVATLELEPRKQYERILANALALPINTVQTEGHVTKQRYDQIKDQLGQIRVARFSPDTPVAEITRWVERLADLWGKVDLLVVDYADLVGSGKSARESDSYRDAKVVGNALRDHALRFGYVTISATQGRRSSGVSKPLDIDDVADSQHKVRVADLVVAMRMDLEQKDMVDWFVILNRDGTDRIGTNPLPTCREMGRMFPVNRYEPW